MKLILSFVPALIVHSLMLALLWFQREKGLLTRLRFTLIFTIGWTLTLLVLYFSAVLLAQPKLDMSVIGPALLIGAVNLVIGFPTAYLGYPLFSRNPLGLWLLARLRKPPTRER
jgi:hypothetical protein